MPINHLNISYPDFVLNTTIDPEQFDTNNAEIVNKINEILDILHSVNGGREIVVDVIESITASTDLQSALVALKTYIDNADNTIKTDLTNKYNEVNGLISTNTSSISSLQLNKADKSNVYTKTESDTKYATKTENSLKADKATTYLRTELYNRTETDSKLSTNKTDIENKLNAHKTSSDHDTRYYTKDELATNILKITNPGININVKDYSTIATEGQTLFTLPSGVYSRVTDLLEVFYEGSKLAVDKNYKILNDTQFQLLDWSAKSGAEVVAQIQAKVWNTQDLVSGRQLQDSTVDMIKLNQETQNKINSIGDTTQITETNLVEAIQNDRLTLESQASDLAQKANKIEVIAQTTANITYYVSPTGNDSNDGLTSGTAFKTIQYAINKLPQIINHTVTINVDSGTYSENVSISGFVGKGQLNLFGGSDLTTAINFNVQSISIAYCTARIYIKGFNATTATNYVFKAEACLNVVFVYCTSTVNATSYNGFYITSSLCTISNCLISNRQYALNATQSSTIQSASWTVGTGNTVGLCSQNASTIGKGGTQPSGTTAETTFTGGVIR